MKGQRRKTDRVQAAATATPPLVSLARAAEFRTLRLWDRGGRPAASPRARLPKRAAGAVVPNVRWSTRRPGRARHERGTIDEPQSDYPPRGIDHKIDQGLPNEKASDLLAATRHVAGEGKR